MTRFPALLAAALLASTSTLAIAQAPPAAAPAAPAPPAAAAAAAADPVLARVDGIEIRQGDLDAAEEDIGGDQTRAMNPDQKRDYLLGFMIDLTIAARAAEARRVQDTADFARKLAYFRNKLLVETLLNAETQARVTEAEARRIYTEQLGRVTPEEEVRARHILVETEDEARAIITQLRGGADFAAVAREKSKDPGAADGGDLGFFTRGQMVSEFATAAFAMQPGDLSTNPVKTQFGWHIIRVEERRQRPVPTFEQVRSQIEDFLTRRVQADLVQQLRQAARVERLWTLPPQPGAPAAPGTPPAQPR